MVICAWDNARVESEAPFNTFCIAVLIALSMLALFDSCHERAVNACWANTDIAGFIRAEAIFARNAGGVPVSLVYIVSYVEDVVNAIIKFHAAAMLALYLATAKPLYLA